ncbi:MAG: transposase domain-containing protein, partial [Ruminococcus sp.]|nr:transposase domain-containing protein [Ruminococcus sp.]
LIESAKANGLDPYAYMEYVFEMLRTGCKVSRLLPWNVKI